MADRLIPARLSQPPSILWIVPWIIKYPLQALLRYRSRGISCPGNLFFLLWALKRPRPSITFVLSLSPSFLFIALPLWWYAKGKTIMLRCVHTTFWVSFCNFYPLAVPFLYLLYTFIAQANRLNLLLFEYKKSICILIKYSAYYVCVEVYSHI